MFQTTSENGIYNNGFNQDPGDLENCETIRNFHPTVQDPYRSCVDSTFQPSVRHAWNINEPNHLLGRSSNAAVNDGELPSINNMPSQNHSNWENLMRKHFTMKNAKTLAKLFQIVNEVKGTVPRFARWSELERQCWAKECWSHNKHSHVQRSRFEDGNRCQLKTIEVEKRGCLASCKQRYSQFYKTSKKSFAELRKNLDPWHSSLKQIEGQYGTAVVSYFIFIKQILKLNLLIFFVILIFVLLPQSCAGIFQHSGEDCSRGGWNSSEQIADCCSSLYIVNETDSLNQKLVDFFFGTGWLEKSYLFYGVYSYQSISCKIGSKFIFRNYNVALAYLLIVFIYFLASLILMVVISAEGLKEGSSYIIGKKGHHYSNKIFAGWDYVIQSHRMADVKHVTIYQELKSDLQEEERLLKYKTMTFLKKFKLYCARLVLNLAVMIMLISSGFLIYVTVNSSLNYVAKYPDEVTILKNLMKYLPSIIIVLLNLCVPIVFQKIVSAENYSPAFEINITLARTVILRLASIFVLLVVLYIQINPELESSANSNQCGMSSESNKVSRCWETLVGQQIYQLTLLDFLIAFGSILILDFPRKLLFTHLKHIKWIEKIGLPEFIVPDHVLDIVYTQCLCWLGTLFSPFMPTITILKCIIIFIVKKCSLLRNYKPSKRVYKASRSSDFFMSILLISFAVASLPVFYTIGVLRPSRGCGPYRIYNTMFSIFVDLVNQGPSYIQIIFAHLTSVTLAFPLFVILCLLLYYFGALLSVNKHMVSALKAQLKLDGKDKQFILRQLQNLTHKQNKKFNRRQENVLKLPKNFQHYSMPNINTTEEQFDTPPLHSHILPNTTLFHLGENNSIDFAEASTSKPKFVMPLSDLIVIPRPFSSRTSLQNFGRSDQENSVERSSTSSPSTSYSPDPERKIGSQIKAKSDQSFLQKKH